MIAVCHGLDKLCPLDARQVEEGLDGALLFGQALDGLSTGAGSTALDIPG